MSTYEDLSNVVDVTSLECLNEKPDKNILGIFPPSGSVLESDCDEQLLMHIAFTTAVKLHSLEFVAPNDGRRPSDVKLFANMRVDFSEAEGSPATQQCQLEWLPHDSSRMKAVFQTKFVKFQNVKNISVFIGSNVDDGETTALSSLTMFGIVLSDMNMSNLKKSG
jgi:hypothetical protein|uniref:PITH domain-containing protein n=2 Tax=Eutreptiella gymnastica TaxID=73025 RepID=A0A7S4G8M3_9EUGL